MIRSRLRCLSSPTDEINFPWKQTSKYFNTVFLMPLYSIYSSYLDFLPNAFFLNIFFSRSFCYRHGKLITGTERVVNVYIRVNFRCALTGRFLTARSERRHSKFKAMRTATSNIGLKLRPVVKSATNTASSYCYKNESVQV